MTLPISRCAVKSCVFSNTTADSFATKRLLAPPRLDAAHLTNGRVRRLQIATSKVWRATRAPKGEAFVKRGFCPSLVFEPRACARAERRRGHLSARSATHVHAATPTPAPLPPLARFGSVVFNANLRTRLEVWDWFTPASGDDRYAYSGNILRFGWSQSKDRWDWNAEFALPLVLGLPANPWQPAPQGALGLGANYLLSNGRSRNAAMVFPKQLYVRITRFGASQRTS